MTVCKMYGKSLFILQSTRKEGLGLKACCQIFFLCCKALPYIFRKKTKQIPRHNVFMLIFKLSQACCVVVAYVFLKSFCIVRAFGAYLFPFFCLLSQKKGFKFLQCWLCFLNPSDTTNYTLWPWQTKVKNCSRKAQFPIESETSKSQRNLFNVNKKIQKKMRREKRSLFFQRLVIVMFI